VIYWQYAYPPKRDRPLNILTQNIGNGTGYFEVPINDWYSVQIRITSSSTETASNGALHVYINTNNEDRPTASRKGVRINTHGWGRNTCRGSHIVWGDGSYNPLTDDDVTANAVVEIADFEYDDQFDPNWAIGVGVGYPARR
jgi:hypothetical protein